MTIRQEFYRTLIVAGAIILVLGLVGCGFSTEYSCRCGKDGESPSVTSSSGSASSASQSCTAFCTNVSKRSN